jgi:hypothetical protein
MKKIANIRVNLIEIKDKTKFTMKNILKVFKN